MLTQPKYFKFCGNKLLLPKMPITYKIHDNGGRPFRIQVDRKNKIAKVMVHKHTDIDDDAEEGSTYFDLMSFSYLAFYPGQDYGSDSIVGMDYADGDGNSHGCNCIFQLNDKTYLHFGRQIVSFTLLPGEVIEEHVSFVGHSDTPRSYIVGNNNYYFFDPGTIISRNYLDNMPCEIPVESPYLRQIMCHPKYTVMKQVSLFDSWNNTLDNPRMINTLKINLLITKQQLEKIKTHY